MSLCLHITMFLYAILLLLNPVSSNHLSFPLNRRTVSGLNAGRQWRHSPSISQRRLYKDIAKVHKESDGVYFTTICIGDSGTQCFTVIVDTGSSTIAVPCKGCNCGSQHSYYDQTQSTSAVDTGSSYSQCYGEGSCNRGKLISDTICFGKNCQADTGINHPFGCCTTFSPNFRTQDADGIIGVSPSSRTLWKDLASHHKLDTNRLAICFGTKDGEMSVGGWDNTIPGVGNSSASDNLKWVDMKTSDSFYRINIQSIVVGQTSTVDGATSSGSQVAGFSVAKPMVDCGSTFSFMRNPNWSRLRQSLISYCSEDTTTRCQSEAGRNPGGDEAGDSSLSLGCYKFSTDDGIRQKQMNTFPSITMQFQESDNAALINMCVPADQYFFLSGPKANVYCGGIFKDSQDVIGANLLANFLVIFQESPSRMGIAKAQCDRNSASGTGTTGSTTGGGTSGSASGGTGGTGGTGVPTNIGMGPCGSPNGEPSSSTANQGDQNETNAYITVNKILLGLGICVFLNVIVMSVLKWSNRCCPFCSSRKYSVLDGDEEKQGLENGDGDEEGDKNGTKDGQNVDGNFELTDQEKARTDELVRAANAIFVAVERGDGDLKDGEDGENSDEDAI